jgi:hypothetical protein
MSGNRLFVHRLVAKGTVPLYFVSCQNLEGRDVHYYLISTPEKMRAYAKARGGEFDLNDYGAIVASGYGKEPSEEMKRRLKETYALNNE